MLRHIFHRSACAHPGATSKGLVAGAVPVWLCPWAAGGGHGATKTQVLSASGRWRVNQLEGEQKDVLMTCSTTGSLHLGLLGLNGASRESWRSGVLFLPA